MEVNYEQILNRCREILWREQTFESVGDTKKEAMDTPRTSNNFKNISGNLNIDTMRVIKKINKKG